MLEHLSTATSAGALVMDWSSAVAGIICAFLPGQAQGHALASLLYGTVNPSGRLPVTMPNRENEMGMSLEQYPGIAYSSGLQTNYSEALEVGYRWYMAHQDTNPAFLFGSGLSYTTFTYSELIVFRNTSSHDWVVETTVTNTGGRSGAEVAQMYMAFPVAAKEPPLQLRGFEKVFLESGSSCNVQFVLNQRALSIWDDSTQQKDGWLQQFGEFKVAVGGSLGNLVQQARFTHSQLSKAKM